MKTKEQTNETKSLFKSLAAFQQEVPVIHKETKGYGYSYADLPTIFNVINPLLAKHELGFTQPIMGDCVKTIIFHVETGESIESLTDIPKGVQLAKIIITNLSNNPIGSYEVKPARFDLLRECFLSSLKPC